MDRNARVGVGDTDFGVVALRKESVDRNTLRNFIDPLKNAVALRKESVDRNNLGGQNLNVKDGRSPQGERG